MSVLSKLAEFAGKAWKKVTGVNRKRNVRGAARERLKKNEKREEERED